MTNNEKIGVQQLPNIEHVIEMMKECKTDINPIVGKDEFTTLVNVVTLEAQSMLIANFMQYLLDIKQGNLHDENNQ